ncbi:phosphotransferase enzyme family protein [Pseudaestuariivita rosea]|uniref:phosphotransferase enzyme family protein n=1 Tax=Pseudaestuariivita rosea TaxID=2763263 RepID=UPI001ABA59BA|nr:phosphotransferase [Pseudaestuariivita rosea]
MTDWTKRAQQAAAAWGGLIDQPRLVAQRENTIFDVRLQSGTRAALRFHRAGYQDADAIEAELLWTEALADQGFPCPRPIRTTSGQLTNAQDVIISVVEWIDAPMLAKINDPRQQIECFLKLGRLLADLHNLTDSGANLPAEKRPELQCEVMTGPNPLWGRYWEHPILTSDQSNALITARDTARDWLSSLQNADTGAIHADAIGENVLIDDNHLWLIDFDDAGHGYRLYDLGVALVQHWDASHLPELMQAICSGYAQKRAVNLALLLDAVPRFMALRALQSAGWIISRAQPEDRRHTYYVTRALQCAERYILKD